ncbi:diaminobutyrate acetyltransferase [Candidimonas nitroreducens]|uniref:L-2,4-diaminobutyric acid acetyltransferase n=1 Tax=Candidimonas nitroreducens TaxID=683354 RepID=A0A225M221_9BURK|nr:diaminobutyrate acetyltransferase [Candidimonas nitroreducens]OWT55166.1 diaminobutyrate acetyltransferase [Candidimonas nitroreducens]
MSLEARELHLSHSIPERRAAAPQQAYGLRSIRKADGRAIHGLIAQCPPLDLNSLYAYLLLSEHHVDTCVLAEDGAGQAVGFVSAYVPPRHPDVLFVWQVAVHPRARGCALARRMLWHLLERPAASAIRYIETTVGPDNAASRGVFAGLARQLHAACSDSALFGPELFGPGGHEEERLLRIGPFQPPASRPR